MSKEKFMKREFQRLVTANAFAMPTSLADAESRLQHLRDKIHDAAQRLGATSSSKYATHALYEDWRRKTNTFIKYARFEMGFLNKYVEVQNAEARHGAGVFNIFGPVAK